MYVQLPSPIGGLDGREPLALGLGSLLFAIWFAAMSAFPAIVRKANSSKSPWIADRKVMGASALGLAALGLVIFVLLLSGPDGCASLSPWTSVVVLTLLLALYTAADAYMLRQSESIRALNRETSAASLQVLFPVLIGWAGLTQLGLPVDFSPLALISILLVTTLIGSFVGRKRIAGQAANG
jgi:hypothetical protein